MSEKTKQPVNQPRGIQFRPVVDFRMLPDGSGRVRIHWFMRDEAGPICTGVVSHSTPLGPVVLGGAKGRIACQPNLESVNPIWLSANHVQPLHHSDDARAATCPECMATPEYAAMMKRLGELASSQ